MNTAMKHSRGIIAKAIAAHQAGRLEEAERGYRRILRGNPQQGDALHFLGMLLFQRGDLSQGVDLVQRSLQFDPANPHAWNNLGNMHLGCDRPADALAAYRRATQLEPTLVPAWYNLGICLCRERRADEALESFATALTLKPDQPMLYERMGMLLYSLGRFREAGEVYRCWLELEPANAVARHMLAAMTNEAVPERADDDYIKTLFDKFASDFDTNLAQLGYQAPQLLVASLGEFLPGDGRLEVLDAGCGTGLCGELLRSWSRRLTGVDLSSGMVDKARERDVYDALEVAELCAFMREHEGVYDLIVAADTLVYFGALEEALAAASQALRVRGLLAFTLERAADVERYRIQPHGRYVHEREYVESAVTAAGLRLERINEVVLRRERGEDVQGMAVFARLDGSGVS